MFLAHIWIEKLFSLSRESIFSRSLALVGWKSLDIHVDIQTEKNQTSQSATAAAAKKPRIAYKEN
jgi:hypothetical protein